MNQEMGEEILTALDLGATKVCALLGVVRDGAVTVIGVGKVPSHGVQKGIVVDVEPTIEAILGATREAEKQAGVKAGPVFASVSGKHIRSMTSDSSVTIPNRDHEITDEELRRAMEQAQLHAELPGDHDVLHTIPEEFSVDGQDGIRNPVGMYGNRLVAKVRIITGSVSCIQTVVRCIQGAELVPQGLIIQSLASVRSVLTPEEREMGVVCLDIGGGTTDMALLVGKTLRHTAVIPQAGNHISKDVSMTQRIPFDAAEAIKKSHGCCSQNEVREDEVVQIAATAGREAREIPRRLLARIIEARVDEILEAAKGELVLSGFTEDALSGGLVLTGGCANLPHIVARAEKVFDSLAARVGTPTGVVGGSDELRKPEYAAAIGLLLEASDHHRKAPIGGKRPQAQVGGWLKWLKDWFKGV